MRILVQKFGGTSVANLDCMRQVEAKVKKYLGQGYKLVVVLSAMSGVTNKLISTAKQWSPCPDKAELDVLMVTGEQQSIALFTGKFIYIRNVKWISFFMVFHPTQEIINRNFLSISYFRRNSFGTPFIGIRCNALFKIIIKDIGTICLYECTDVFK